MGETELSDERSQLRRPGDKAVRPHVDGKTIGMSRKYLATEPLVGLDQRHVGPHRTVLVAQEVGGRETADPPADDRDTWTGCHEWPLCQACQQQISW
jgi:hypothetical protein